MWDKRTRTSEPQQPIVSASSLFSVLLYLPPCPRRSTHLQFSFSSPPLLKPSLLQDVKARYATLQHQPCDLWNRTLRRRTQNAATHRTRPPVLQGIYKIFHRAVREHYVLTRNMVMRRPEVQINNTGTCLMQHGSYDIAFFVEGIRSPRGAKPEENLLPSVYI